MSNASEKTVEEQMREHSARHGPKDPGRVLQPELSLEPDRLRPMYGMWAMYQVCVPAGTNPDELLRPEYWQRVAGVTVRTMDKLWIDTDDGAFVGLMQVQRADSHGLVVGWLIFADTKVPLGVRDAGIRNTIGGRSEYRGPVRKWAAEVNGAVLRDGFESQALADQWLWNYIRTREARP